MHRAGQDILVPASEGIHYRPPLRLQKASATASGEKPRAWVLVPAGEARFFVDATFGVWWPIPRCASLTAHWRWTRSRELTRGD
jgi:hypothetical protein